MIVPQQAALASRRIRAALPEASRVLIARTDGIAMYDDSALAERDLGAAISATLLGVAQSNARGFKLGELDTVAVATSTGRLYAWLVDEQHALVVVGSLALDGEATAAAVAPVIEQFRGGPASAKAAG